MDSIRCVIGRIPVCCEEHESYLPQGGIHYHYCLRFVGTLLTLHVFTERSMIRKANLFLYSMPAVCKQSCPDKNKKDNRGDGQFPLELKQTTGHKTIYF